MPDNDSLSMMLRSSRPAGGPPPRRRRRRLWTLPDGKNSLRVPRPGMLPGILPGLLLLLGLAACGRPSVGETPDPARGANGGAGGEAYLRGRLYGAIDAPLDWHGPTLDCEGMPRPEGAGARLRFARRLEPGGAQLVVIIGVDGLAADVTLSGSPATITVIDERTSRFFSNAGRQCWADITAQDPVADSDTARAVTGRAYCTGALAAVNGSGSVSLAEFEFRGRIDWAADGGAAP